MQVTALITWSSCLLSSAEKENLSSGLFQGTTAKQGLLLQNDNEKVVIKNNIILFHKYIIKQ